MSKSTSRNQAPINWEEEDAEAYRHRFLPPFDWPQAPEHVIDELADVMKVPDDGRQLFKVEISQWINHSIWLVGWEKKGKSIPSPAGKRLDPSILIELKGLREIADAMNLYLEDISNTAVKWVAILGISGKEYGFEHEEYHRFLNIRATEQFIRLKAKEASELIDHYKQTAKFLSDSLAEIEIAFPKRLPVRPKKDAFGPGSSPFDGFFLCVLNSTRKAGGKATLSAKNETGTLIEFMCKVAPHMPPGTMPGLNAQTFSRMEHLKTKFGKK
jgi:hypothetical protein